MDIVLDFLRLAVLPPKIIGVFLKSVNAQKKEEALEYFNSAEFLNRFKHLFKENLSDEEMTTLIQFYQNPTIQKWMEQSEPFARPVYESMSQEIANKFLN